MITVANSAALVKGAAQSAPKVVKLEVTRAFCINGRRLEVGETLEVPDAFARELQYLGKAIAYVDKPAPAKPARQEKPK